MLLLLLGTVVASAQGTNGSTTTLYRLNAESSFQQGCFPPCMCPVMIGVPVTGTFLLTPTGFDGLFNTYAVNDVNWIFWINGTATAVTGSGTYKVGGEVAVLQELSLDLQLGSDTVQHFDSGLVAESASFPDIKVIISIHGLVCLDKVFSVSASPAPLEPELHIHLASANTVALSWVATPAPCVLQASSDLATWTIVTNRPTVLDQQNQIVLDRSSGNRFFRLQRGGN